MPAVRVYMEEGLYRALGEGAKKRVSRRLAEMVSSHLTVTPVEVEVDWAVFKMIENGADLQVEIAFSTGKMFNPSRGLIIQMTEAIVRWLLEEETLQIVGSVSVWAQPHPGAIWRTGKRHAADRHGGSGSD